MQYGQVPAVIYVKAPTAKGRRLCAVGFPEDLTIGFKVVLHDVPRLLRNDQEPNPEFGHNRHGLGNLLGDTHEIVPR